MAIFLTEKSRVIVQGMTGSEGQKHTSRMLAAGTNIVGGVTPGQGRPVGRLRQALDPGLRLVRRRGEVGRRGRVGGVRAAALHARAR